MGNYAEEYNIAGVHCCIEDYKSPGEHFMPHQKHGRFKCWVGGCGICVGHDTLSEAHEHLVDYSAERLNKELHSLLERAHEYLMTRELLWVGKLSALRIYHNQDAPYIGSGI